MTPREEVLDLIASARAMVPPMRLDDLPPSQVIPNVPAWHRHETGIWTLGEEARQAFVKNPRLRRDPELLAAMLPLVDDRAAGRGRQAWVMLFGSVACAPFAARIAPLLHDPDVQGHAIDALIKMRVRGYAASVQPLADSPTAWIRNLARRYLDRFSDPTAIGRS